MSKPVSVSNWLLQFLLKETADKLPETACSNIKASCAETQLVKVIKVPVFIIRKKEKSYYQSGPDW